LLEKFEKKNWFELRVARGDHDVLKSSTYSQQMLMYTTT